MDSPPRRSLRETRGSIEEHRTVWMGTRWLHPSTHAHTCPPTITHTHAHQLDCKRVATEAGCRPHRLAHPFAHPVAPVGWNAPTHANAMPPPPCSPWPRTRASHASLSRRPLTRNCTPSLKLSLSSRPEAHPHSGPPAPSSRPPHALLTPSSRPPHAPLTPSSCVPWPSAGASTP